MASQSKRVTSSTPDTSAAKRGLDPDADPWDVDSSAVSEKPKLSGHETRTITFEDNQLMPELCGHHDCHLSRIEHKLSVALAARGNAIQITGGAGAIQDATVVLNDLYSRLEQGMAVALGEVDGAVAMAGGAVGDAPSKKKPRTSDPARQIRTKRSTVTPRTPGQADYLEALKTDELVFGVGPAGTGKTYMAVAMAVSLMLEGKVDRLILSRPAVEAGEKLGFLPGDMRDKIDPYLRPLYDALYDMLPGDQVMKKLESGEIEVAPLAFMRGRTLSNAFVILDEAQNCTVGQMKMFLTRLGENSRMAVTGDPSQIDLPMGARSGLTHALDALHGVKGIKTVRFTHADVVRHPLVTRIVKAYNDADPELLKAPGGQGQG
ncbi:MAG: PhoH family protein [Alphaproteobacteria bacterium]